MVTQKNSSKKRIQKKNTRPKAQAKGTNTIIIPDLPDKDLLKLMNQVKKQKSLSGITIIKNCDSNEILNFMGLINNAVITNKFKKAVTTNKVLKVVENADITLGYYIVYDPNKKTWNFID